jgi:hypothetical protein
MQPRRKLQSQRALPEQGSKTDEVVVFMSRRAGQCAGCGVETGHGVMIRLVDEKAYCLSCAGLGDLELLPSGDAAITRRAKKYSKRWAVVVRWSTARKRFERQGLLVEPQAIGQAEDESLSDAEQRKKQREHGAAARQRDDEKFVRQFAEAIRRQYPSCPPQEEFAIARHACTRNSGRVGRKQAARELESTAIRSAVIAHIRHVHTDYDERISRRGDRDTARDEVGELVATILDRWSDPPDELASDGAVG